MKERVKVALEHKEIEQSIADMILDEGNTVPLTGTVKKHDTYKDVKQTQLTRCKIA